MIHHIIHRTVLILTSLVLTQCVNSQDVDPKLLEQEPLDSMDLIQLAAFDTLPSWVQRNEVSVDTTVIVSDQVLFSVLLLGNTSGTDGLYYLMSFDRIHQRALDLEHLCDQPDIDQSACRYAWAKPSVWTSGEVCVMEYDCRVTRPGTLHAKTTMTLSRRRFWNVRSTGLIQSGGWEEVER